MRAAETMTLDTPVKIGIEIMNVPAHLYPVTLQAKLLILVVCHVLYFLLAAPAGAH